MVLKQQDRRTDKIINNKTKELFLLTGHFSSGVKDIGYQVKMIYNKSHEPGVYILDTITTSTYQNLQYPNIIGTRILSLPQRSIGIKLLGAISIQRHHITSRGIPIIKIRHSHSHLIFIMGILILCKMVFILKWEPNPHSVVLPADKCLCT